MQLDWQTLTRERAARLIGAASRASNAADDKARELDTDEAVEAAMRAYQTLEDLRVYVICGEKPA